MDLFSFLSSILLELLFSFADYWLAHSAVVFFITDFCSICCCVYILSLVIRSSLDNIHTLHFLMYLVLVESSVHIFILPRHYEAFADPGYCDLKELSIFGRILQNGC